jgi:hypothetical protein
LPAKGFEDNRNPNRNRRESDYDRVQRNRFPDRQPFEREERIEILAVVGNGSGKVIGGNVDSMTMEKRDITTSMEAEVASGGANLGEVRDDEYRVAGRVSTREASQFGCINRQISFAPTG